VALYYNVATQAQEVDEYNYLYTAAPLGACNPVATACLAAPLGATGYTDYIVPTDAAWDLGFVLSNDPRPFFAHVTNLTGDRLAYPLLDQILSTYRGMFSSSTPPVTMSFTQSADILTQHAAWATAGLAASPPVSGYLQDGLVHVTGSGSTQIPLTAPEGTTVSGAAFGESYGSERSAWFTGDLTAAVPTPSITSAAAATFTTRVAGTMSVTTTGAKATLAVAGTLPAGVTFVDNGDGTGTLAGTPAVGTGGKTYPLTVTATGSLATASQAFVLTVDEAPQITSAAAVAFNVGTAGTFAVTTSGSTPSVAVTGPLPTGVTFVDNGNGTGTLAGTPAVGTGGIYPLTVTAVRAPVTMTQALVLTVNQGLAITSASSAKGQANTAFSFTVTTSGFPTPALTSAGTLPPGTTFTDKGDGTATIAGTLAVTASGSYVLTVTATNGNGTATQKLTITTGSVVKINLTDVGTAKVGSPFAKTFSFGGSPAAAITVGGTLPAGLAFKDLGNGTATLSGMPKAGAGGVYRISLTGSNAFGSSSQVYTLTVKEKPTFTSASKVTMKRGKAKTFTVRVRGYSVPTISRSGALPKGMKFKVSTSGTATFSGTPKKAGRYKIVLTAKNNTGTVKQTLIITVK